MALRVGVGNLAKNVTTLRIGVDNVAKSVTKLYIGDENNQAQLVYQAGISYGSLPVGSKVLLNVNSTPTEFIVVHQGLPSSMYDASCDGTWLLMKDIYEERQWSNPLDNRYKESGIHAYLNETFLNMFNTDIREVIKQVKIPYVNGFGDAPVDSGANGLSCKIFLLSGYEIGWTRGDNEHFPQDGAVLSYFQGISSSDPKRIAYFNGLATNWWLRSPFTSSTNRAWVVLYSGFYQGGVVNASYGIRPALIMPKSAIATVVKE